MIEMVDHLGLVERHAPLERRRRPHAPSRSVAAPAVAFELRRCAEQGGVARHVEHRWNVMPQGLSRRPLPPGAPRSGPEPIVDLAVSSASARERNTGAVVVLGLMRDLLGRQREARSGSWSCSLEEEERELRPVSRTDCEEPELVPSMDRREDRVTVLEVDYPRRDAWCRRDPRRTRSSSCRWRCRWGQ